MNEDNHLFAHLQNPFQLIIDYLIHDLVCSVSIAVVLYAIEPTFQRSRPVARVKVESSLTISSNESRDVLIVGESSRESYNSNRLLGLCAGHHRPGNETFEDETSLVVEQMDFIDDYHIDDIHHSICLSSHDIPLLRSRDDDVCLLDLLLAHIDITGEFSHLDVEIAQGALELVNDFRRQSL